MIDIKNYSSKEKVLIVCLYFAQLKKTDPKYKEWEDVKKILSKKYAIKPNTIKNDKDYYDAFFDNGRKGWWKEDKRSIISKKIFEEFNEYSLENLEYIVNNIIDDAKNTTEIFALKTKISIVANAVIKRDKEIEFDGINLYKDDIEIGCPVFIVLGGDSSKRQITWEKGLWGVGIITKKPYSINGKNFKIQIETKVIFDKPITKEDLILYAETYDISYIGVELKRDHTQAIAKLNSDESKAVIRVILDTYPDTEKLLIEIFGQELIKKAKEPATMFIEKLVNYGDKTQSLIEHKEQKCINKEIRQYNKEKFLEEVFINDKKYEIITNLLEYKKNIIIQGPPGVGKTYMAKRLAYSIMNKIDDSKIKFIQFHQSYAYEDFMRGYRPTDDTGNFKLVDGPFFEICDEARKTENKNEKFFLIIDEINRGKISKIFGELLMLIENDKRGQEIELLYKHENESGKFSVPENLYIIGMMNTADRSLAMIDYALRRRFAFFELEPVFNNKELFKKFQNKYSYLFSDRIYENVIEKIKVINEEIAKDDCDLGKEYQIGHSYFCAEKKDNLSDWLKSVIEYEILPLLEEYFIDNKDKFKNYANELRSIFESNGEG